MATVVQVRGDRLKYWRTRKMMTQWELSMASLVSVNTISLLETGEQATARIKTARSLADALGVEPEELVSWDENDATPAQESEKVG